MWDNLAADLMILFSLVLDSASRWLITVGRWYFKTDLLFLTHSEWDSSNCPPKRVTRALETFALFSEHFCPYYTNFIYVISKNKSEFSLPCLPISRNCPPPRMAGLFQNDFNNKSVWGLKFISQSKTVPRYNPKLTYLFTPFCKNRVNFQLKTWDLAPNYLEKKTNRTVMRNDLGCIIYTKSSNLL